MIVAIVISVVTYIFVMLSTYVFGPLDELMKLYKLSNPLWKIPMSIFWPITVILLVSVIPVTIIMEYIREIKKYYKEKNDET